MVMTYGVITKKGNSLYRSTVDGPEEVRRYLPMASLHKFTCGGIEVRWVGPSTKLPAHIYEMVVMGGGKLRGMTFDQAEEWVRTEWSRG